MFLRLMASAASLDAPCERMSCSSCVRARFASSSARTFFCPSIWLKISFLLTSSSALRTAYFAFKSAVWSSAVWTAASALALTISWSACSRSLRFCAKLYSCWLGSNSNTTSPACTCAPAAANWTICNVPPAMGGAERPLDCSVCSAPFVNTFSCRSTSFTVVVGTSASPASTVVCRQATPLPPNAIASRNAPARALFFRNMKFLLSNRWILERQSFTRLQSLGNQSFIAALARHFHGNFFEFRSSLHVGHGSSRLPEKSIRRDHNPIGDTRHRDTNGCSHSRCEPRVGLSQAQLHRKISRHRPSRTEIHAGRRTDRVHMPVEAAVWKCIEPHRCGLTQLQLAPFCFFHASGDLQRGTVGKLRDRRTRPRPVTELECGWAALRLPMILQCHHAIKRSA